MSRGVFDCSCAPLKIMEPQRHGKIKDGIVDDFSEAASWLAVASGQAKLKLTSEPGTNGRALRLDFDFKGGGGFVGARKDFALRLPEAYAFSFRVRGAAPRNKLEFKLADPGGRNVWRWQEDAFDFRSEPRALFLKSSEIEFAWGPAGAAPCASWGRSNSSSAPGRAARERSGSRIFVL